MHTNSEDPAVSKQLAHPDKEIEGNIPKTYYGAHFEYNNMYEF